LNSFRSADKHADLADRALAEPFRMTYVLVERPYRCGRCRAWHITSTPRPKARRKK